MEKFCIYNCFISLFCCSIQMLEQIVKIQLRFISFIISTEDYPWRCYLTHMIPQYTRHSFHQNLYGTVVYTDLVHNSWQQLRFYPFVSFPTVHPEMLHPFLYRWKKVTRASHYLKVKDTSSMIINPLFQSQLPICSMSGSLPLLNYSVCSLIWTSALCQIIAQCLSPPVLCLPLSPLISLTLFFRFHCGSYRKP